MFALADRPAVDAEIALDLAIITDELFAGQDIDIANALCYLLVRPDAVALSRTLITACAGLLDLFVPTDPDRPLYEFTDALATRIMTEIWKTPARIEQAQALLQVTLDEPALDNLSKKLRWLLDNEPGSDIILTQAKLITGMSAMLARADNDPLAGNPLRRVLAV
jgi:hypothetical protein